MAFLTWTLSGILAKFLQKNERFASVTLCGWSVPLDRLWDYQFLNFPKFFPYQFYHSMMVIVFSVLSGLAMRVLIASVGIFIRKLFSCFSLLPQTSRRPWCSGFFATSVTAYKLWFFCVVFLSDLNFKVLAPKTGWIWFWLSYRLVATLWLCWKSACLRFW